MRHQDIGALALALSLAGAFGATAGWSRRTSPRLATFAVMTMSGVLTASLAATLAALALPLLGRSDAIADHAHWSDAVFRRTPSVSLLVSLVSAAALAVAAVRLVRRVQTVRAADAAALRLRDQLGSTYGDTVVAALPDADAMALSSGIIVVTPSLLRELGPDERRAVLAHERAHIDHRHHSIRNAAVLIAAANPLLRRLPEEVVYLTERWADEVAATTTTRKTTAAALVQAARLQVGPPRFRGAAHSVATGVPGRVQALDHASSRPHLSRLVAPALLVTVAAMVAIAAGERTLDLFQLAHALERVRSTR